jgi:hypothetical protein
MNSAGTGSGGASGGTQGVDAGVSCEDAQRLSSMLVGEAIDTADRSCETPEDCVHTSIDTGCTASCGTVASTTGAQQIAEAVATINASYCADYENLCGPVLVPPCVAPQPLSCVDNLCVEGNEAPLL